MKKETYLYVQFKNCPSKWIYNCGGTFCVGDIVEAPTFNGSTTNIAIVKKIVKLKDNKLPIEKEKILTITKKLDTYEKDFYPLNFMKKYIKQDYLKEWKYVGKNSWAKFYESSFDGEISYEKDGVLTCSFGDFTTDDCFLQYTITTRKNFDLKIEFLQTALSELYYKKISEQDFAEFLNIVSGC